MKNIAYICLIIGLGSITTLADNLTAKDGKTYYDVEIITNRCAMMFSVFKHRNGVAKVVYSDMSDSDKGKFGYNLEKFVAIREAKSKAVILEQEHQKEKQERETKFQILYEKNLHDYRKAELTKSVFAVNGTAYDFFRVIDAEKKYSEAKDLIDKFDKGYFPYNTRRGPFTVELDMALEHYRPYMDFGFTGKVLQILNGGIRYS